METLGLYDVIRSMHPDQLITSWALTGQNVKGLHQYRGSTCETRISQVSRKFGAEQAKSSRIKQEQNLFGDMGQSWSDYMIEWGVT